MNVICDKYNIFVIWKDHCRPPYLLVIQFSGCQEQWLCLHEIIRVMNAYH